MIRGLLNKKIEADNRIVQLEKELADINADVRSLLEISERAIKETKVLKNVIVKMEVDAFEQELKWLTLKMAVKAIMIIVMVVLFQVIMVL